MSFIDKNYVYLNLDVKTNTELFEKVGNDLIAGGIVKDTYVKALIDREAEFPTGLPLPIGVAIPHTDGSHVIQNRIVPVTLKEPIEFNEMGGDEEDKVQVKLIVFIVMADGKDHLDMLQNIIMSVQNESVVNQLLETEDIEEFEQIFTKNILNGGNE